MSNLHIGPRIQDSYISLQRSAGAMLYMHVRCTAVYLLLSTLTAFALHVPDFFLLGVQKSSTTFLTKLLTKHPSLCCGRTKEPHYFDSIDALGSRDDEMKLLLQKRYIKNFKRCKRNKTFDATPLTWLMPHILNQTYSKEQLARKRFIVILRHPVDREFSWYNHQLRSCLYQMRKRPFTKEDKRHEVFSSLLEIKTCGKILHTESNFEQYNGTESDRQLLLLKNLKRFSEYAEPPANLRGDSLYVQVLRKWLRVIHRDQLLILNFNDVTRNVTATFAVLSKFLQLQVPLRKDFKTPIVTSSRVSGSILDCQTARHLHTYFERENQDLLEIINGDSNKSRLIGGGKPAVEPHFGPMKADYACV